jgi:hypothetical protein
MTKQYIIHDAVDTHSEQPATLADGSPVTALVPSLHIQLVPADGNGGTIQLPILQATLEQKAQFVDGATVNLTLEVV